MSRVIATAIVLASLIPASASARHASRCWSVNPMATVRFGVDHSRERHQYPWPRVVPMAEVFGPFWWQR